MIKDITLGQFFPGNSVAHRLDARFKIIIVMIYIIMLFCAGNIFSLFIAGAYAFVMYMFSKIQMKLIIKSMKPLIPILIFTGFFNLFFLDGGTVYFDWGIISLTSKGIKTTIFMIIRIVFLVTGSSLLTYTTSPIVLTDAIESLLSPLKKLKLPVHEFAMMMTIALRFIPTLIEETDKIMSAQKARGADFESGNLMHKAKALIPVFIPLIVSAFRRAEELALAMTCRCYRGGEGRTKLKQLKSTGMDYVALTSVTVFFAAVITVNILV